VISSESPSLVRQVVTFTATITSTFGPIPDGGTVTFYDAASAIGSGVTAGGVATFTTSALSGKTHVVRATYGGSPAFRSSSGTVLQVVIDYFSFTSVTSTLNPAHYGEPVTFTAAVTSGVPNKPTGTVTFRRGTRLLGTATLAAGVATLTGPRLPVGTIPITANYNGDASTAKSAAAMTATVVRALTSAVLTSSADPSLPGRIVRFTATVTSPTTVVTGQVSFMDGEIVLATANLAGGKANYGTAAMGTGVHRITAVYHGTANTSGCASSLLIQKVN
jgi:hypothetical protein